MLNPLKTEVSQFLGVSKDALHVHLGLLILLVAALILRRSLGNPLPLLCVLLLELGNELLDFLRWHTSAAYSLGESGKDVVNTMLWPAAIFLAVRYGGTVLHRLTQRGDVDRTGERGLITKAKDWARSIKRDVVALWIAARDPRTPWYAKLAAGFIAAYALSPIDLIPDVIPVLGYLDDLLLVPLGILLVVKMIPAPLMAEFKAAAALRERPTSRLGLGLVVGMWVVAAIAGGWWWLAR